MSSYFYIFIIIIIVIIIIIIIVVVVGYVRTLVGYIRNGRLYQILYKNIVNLDSKYLTL